MTIQISIIGLGQIGASIGLSLAKHKDLVECTGYDASNTVGKEARSRGAIKNLASSLQRAVEKADIVLLAVPTEQLRETLEICAPSFKEGVVVMDTAPVKSVVAEWVEELLPKDSVKYVGLTPILNPEFLIEDAAGIQAAHPDLFRGGIIAIASHPTTDGEAVKKAADLARLLGAEVLLSDTSEVDGLMASAHIVPQIIAAALLNATVDKPGWWDVRKFAGRAYAEVSGPIVHLGEPGSLTETAVRNKTNVVRVIDNVIASLQIIRDRIENSDSEALTDTFEKARAGRELWWKDRLSSSWSGESNTPQPLPSPGSRIFGNMLGLGKKIF